MYSGIHLRDADVDLQRGMLTIRQTKFAKSRQLPVHPSTVKALWRYPAGIRVKWRFKRLVCGNAEWQFLAETNNT